MKNKAALLGQSGVEKYSLSPMIHNTFFKNSGIDGEYTAMAILPENLGDALKTLLEEGYSGTNLTIPHKINAMEFLDEIDNSAKKIGAVNTVLFKDGKMIGYNTDAFGFIENIDKKIENWRNNDKALIIGTGGASRAVLHGLLENGIKDITIVNRTLEKARFLADEFDINYDSLGNLQNLISERNLIINTTSMGMNDLNALKVNFSNASENTIAYDIVYTPLMTEFLKNAQSKNLRAVDGLGMLLFQAAKSFEIWFGTYPQISSDLINNCLRRLNESN